MEKLDITERLRGKVRVPVNDGAGLLDGKDFFERSFPTSKAAMEAADEIESLRAQLETVKKVIDDQVSVYEGLENKGGLTELGRHGKLVSENIRRDIYLVLQKDNQV